MEFRREFGRKLRAVTEKTRRVEKTSADLLQLYVHQDLPIRLRWYLAVMGAVWWGE